jgi:DNA invertase Pin-like site-specific DNA recombinase
MYLGIKLFLIMYEDFTYKILILLDELSSTCIYQLSKSGLAKRKAEGKTLGRPKGVTNAVLKLDVHAGDIRDYLDKGVSKRSIAKLLGCAESTLYDWLARRVPTSSAPVSRARR